MRTKRIEVHESGGNIFADLGLPDADNHFLKAQIVAELYRLTNARKLTQDKAGALMEISQPEVSRLFKGNLFLAPGRNAPRSRSADRSSSNQWQRRTGVALFSYLPLVWCTPG